MSLKNKTIMITGGVRDIGREISLKLAKSGANLVVNYFGSEEQANSLREQISSMGGQAVVIKGDMTSATDVGNWVNTALDNYGTTIHGLVNVAGGLVKRQTIEEMDQEFFDYVMRLNLTSTFLTTKATVPHMGEGASIVNFASQAGRDGGGPGASAYATSKGAVMTFTRSMAKELGPQGIRVNALCPGMISTTFHDTFTNDNVRTNVANGTPLRREGRPNEVADAVEYLLSENSSFLTGVNMDVNGGLLFS